MRYIFNLCVMVLSFSVSLAARAYIISDPTGTGLTAPGVNTYGVNHDGVALIQFNTGGSCTGSLLSSGRHVLTAGHCITDLTGALDVISATISWPLGNGAYTSTSDTFFVHPLFTGVPPQGFDVALLQLDGPASTLVPRYDLFRDSNSVFRIKTIKIGYGDSGYGATGQTINRREKRSGVNQWELYLSAYGNSVALYDFDSGNPANDAIRFFFGLPEDLGFGIDEVLAGNGDSGGPSFIFENGKALIAGIASFGLSRDPTPPDYDTIHGNRSWGEVGADTLINLPGILSFIDPIVGIPEPSTIALCSIGIGVMGWLRQTTKGKRRAPEHFA